MTGEARKCITATQRTRCGGVVKRRRTLLAITEVRR